MIDIRALVQVFLHETTLGCVALPASSLWLLDCIYLHLLQVGSWVYTSLIAIELARSLHQSAMLRPDTQTHMCEYQYHLTVYHVIGGGYVWSYSFLYTT